MKSNRHEKSCRVCWLLSVLLLSGLMAGLFLPAAAQEQNAEQGIRFTADQVIVDNKGKYTEFSGKVQLFLKDTRIDADWLKVTYKADIKKLAGMSIDEKAIDSIFAKGNVTLEFNDMVANTQEAVYSSENDTFVLTGENTTLTSGRDTIVCDKVTINVTDQTFKAESTGKTPVEAIFYNAPEKLKQQ